MSIVHWWLRRSAPADLTLITDYLRVNRIGLNMESEIVSKFQDQTCGGLEGYTFHGELLATVQMLRRANVNLDSITMDAPLWFGHYDPEPAACHVSIDETIERTILNIADILTVYPSVKIIWIEPLGIMAQPDWKEAMLAFKLGLTRRLGIRIGTVQMDIDWTSPQWRQRLPVMRDWLRQQNMNMGVFYNASGVDANDRAWIDSAVSHFETIEGTLGIMPSQAVFSTWYPYPSRNLPETSDTALTWLVNRYALPRSRLYVQPVGIGAKGRLTQANGKPIAGAVVNAYVAQTDLTAPLPVQAVTGVVPPGATSALLGMRLNTECDCQGFNDVLIGTIAYRETGGGTLAGSYTLPPVYRTYGPVMTDAMSVGGNTVTRIVSDVGQPFGPTGEPFPVTVGATYRFSAPMGAVGGNGWYGNVILVWLGAAGEIGRVGLTPGPGVTVAGSVVTDANGAFALPRFQRRSLGGQPSTVTFDGGGTYRSTTWSPFR